MIDFEEMRQRQESGLQEVDSLQEDEKMVLKHYCSLAAEAILRLGSQRKAPVAEVVVNAYKNGIALGLQLSVAWGELQSRQ